MGRGGCCTGHWAREGRHSTEAVENLQDALLSLRAENYPVVQNLILILPIGSSALLPTPIRGILGSTPKTARGNNRGWEVQKWALHQAEKVNVEKLLPVGAY